MKILKAVLFSGILFSIIYCKCLSDFNYTDYFYSFLDNEFNITDNSASVSNCTKRGFSDEEKEYGAYKCCYTEYTCTFKDEDDEEDNVIYTSSKYCTFVTKESYSIIGKEVDELKKMCSKFKFDCKGNALLSNSGKILYLTLILFFL